MAKLTKSERSAAAKKGWRKRRRKGTKKRGLSAKTFPKQSSMSPYKATKKKAAKKVAKKAAKKVAKKAAKKVAKKAAKKSVDKAKRVISPACKAAGKKLRLTGASSAGKRLGSNKPGGCK
jgi:hypothetical protein